MICITCKNRIIHYLLNDVRFKNLDNTVCVVYSIVWVGVCSQKIFLEYTKFWISWFCKVLYGDVSKEGFTSCSENDFEAVTDVKCWIKRKRAEAWTSLIDCAHAARFAGKFSAICKCRKRGAEILFKNVNFQIKKTRNLVFSVERRLGGWHQSRDFELIYFRYACYLKWSVIPWEGNINSYSASWKCSLLWLAKRHWSELSPEEQIRFWQDYEAGIEKLIPGPPWKTKAGNNKTSPGWTFH